MQPFRYPLTSQPQSGARIKWSNPITRDLVFDFEACAGQVNLATGIKGTLNPSGISTTAGRYGIERTYSGSQAANACSFGNLTVLKDATKTTFDILVKFNAGNPTARIATQWDDGYQNWDFEANAGTLIWVPCDDASGNRTRFDLTGAFPTAGYYRIQAIWLGGAAKKLVINGVDRTASITVRGTAGSILSGSFDSLQIGSSVAYANLNGSVVWTRAWKRALSNAELKYITDNPWQLLSNSENQIFIGVGAAGGGDATATPTGVQATGAVGTPVATGAANAYPAGVVATGAAGTPTAVGGTSIPATVTPTGVSAAWSVGSPVATGAAKALPSGVSVTGAIGTPAATGAAKALPTGVSATGSVGTPIAVAGGSAVATPAGVSANWYVGTPAATGAAVAFPSGVSASSAVGAPVAVAGGAAVALPTGVQAVGSVGTPVAMGAAIAYPLGLAGYWSVGQPVAVVPVAAYWPIPSQVLSGITYGPTGADYTGTATAGGYPTAADIAAAVRADLTAELARIDAAISSRSTVAAIMGATAP